MMPYYLQATLDVELFLVLIGVVVGFALSEFSNWRNKKLNKDKLKKHIAYTALVYYDAAIENRKRVKNILETLKDDYRAVELVLSSDITVDFNFHEKFNFSDWGEILKNDLFFELDQDFVSKYLFTQREISDMITIQKSDHVKLNDEIKSKLCSCDKISPDVAMEVHDKIKTYLSEVSAIQGLIIVYIAKLPNFDQIHSEEFRQRIAKISSIKDRADFFKKEFEKTFQESNRKISQLIEESTEENKLTKDKLPEIINKAVQITQLNKRLNQLLVQYKSKLRNNFVSDSDH